MADNPILSKMLDRLYTSVLSGPALNCRPHSSRQRIDLMQLKDFAAPDEIVRGLLGEERGVSLSTLLTEPPVSWAGRGDASEEQKRGIEEWRGMQAVLKKLNIISDDAATYEQDTGTSVLYLGFPILSFPPQRDELRSQKRILAPLVFAPIRMEVKTGRVPGITLRCAEEGVDRVKPNAGLLSWIERQTGKKMGELFADENGDQPWTEISEIIKAVAETLRLPVPEITPETQWSAVPKTDSDDLDKPTVICGAVLGLFPSANQGLIRDTMELMRTPSFSDPIRSFLQSRPGTEAASSPPEQAVIHDELLVSQADPCQARAVRMARVAKGLVVHGPPGTGKSQTITNIIGDHLARGQRVLFVCDKRTALEVVQYRLESIGLGHLCAVVHDPERDRKPLYLSLRKILDDLTETVTPARPRRLEKINDELKQLHQELAEFSRAMMQTRESCGKSVHELVGLWLQVADEGAAVKCELTTATLEDVDKDQRAITEIFTRARAVDYQNNPWVGATDMPLESLLGQPLAAWKQELGTLGKLAQELDESTALAAKVLSPDRDLERQAQLLKRFSAELKSLLNELTPEYLAEWAENPEMMSTTAAELGKTERSIAVLEKAVDDSEHAPVLSEFSTKELLSDIADLSSYNEISGRWYSFVYRSRSQAATRVLRRFGLSLNAVNGTQALRYLEQERARRAVNKFLRELPVKSNERISSPADLLHSVRLLRRMFALFSDSEHQPYVEDLRTCQGPEEWKIKPDRLQKSAEQARRVLVLAHACIASKMLNASFVDEIKVRCCASEPVASRFAKLEQEIGTLEGVLRLNVAIHALSREIGEAARAVLRDVKDCDQWPASIRYTVLHSQIRRELKGSPELQRVDREYLNSSFQHYRDLKNEKAAVVRETAQAVWLGRQRERLLATTGSRLNGAGAELRRRLYVKGAKAMRLRQVIMAGLAAEEGDALFDLKPVWMASPETVAQIFPARQLFDVLIFDEASQCRLEEALPVMTRAARVVIAGDPKQLPPTRFFESAVSSSEVQEAEDEQGWFEIQQSDVEDLLAAALNLEIEQSFLDVHYRSRNADLIEFSNQSFYSSRLQSIPAHPSHKAKVPPLRLRQVNGIYDERTNRVEAEEVVKIVRELLAQENPPSIGIACFNLPQRDLVSDLLKAEAMKDALFAAAYERARSRRGVATFEGLFIKNLENVQGDERDHIIISTTYGRDPKEKFRRNFGPLSSAGGGRRLNVLVTRAREVVHLVTSIPQEQYSALPPLAAGQNPNGAYLLFSYLRYAERLQELYSHAAETPIEKAVVEAMVHVSSTTTPSVEAEQIGGLLRKEASLSSVVHWGNEGFCIDVAVLHPWRPDDVTVGVLCDTSRYSKTDDTIEWDVFRTDALQAQGWKLVRVVSPAVFRDREAVLDGIKKEHSAFLADEAMQALPASGRAN